MRRVRFAARLATELIGCFPNVNLPFRALEEAPGCPHWCAARYRLRKFEKLIPCLSALPLAGRALATNQIGNVSAPVSPTVRLPPAHDIRAKHAPKRINLRISFRLPRFVLPWLVVRAPGSTVVHPDCEHFGAMVGVGRITILLGLRDNGADAQHHR